MTERESRLCDADGLARLLDAMARRVELLAFLGGENLAETIMVPGLRLALDRH